MPKRTQVEFERTASIPGLCSPSLLISGDGVKSVVATFRESPVITDVSFVTDTAEGGLYRLTWGEPLPEFIERVQDADGTILSAIAVDESWTIDLRFPNQNAASRFYTRYDDPDNPITIHKTSSTGSSQSRGEVLTAEQRVALKRAVETGYFEVPRQTNLAELANEMGISDSAVSQRLRRGLSNILQAAPQQARKQSNLRNH